ILKSTHHKFMIDNLIYAILDLMDVKLSSDEKHKSLFSPQFAYRKRLTKLGNYDSIVQNK
ncbi:MAG: hypothetical protein D6767_08120, partial [Candidatus Hydrogenedentota bacterium]